METEVKLKKQQVSGLKFISISPGVFVPIVKCLVCTIHGKNYFGATVRYSSHQKVKEQQTQYVGIKVGALLGNAPMNQGTIPTRLSRHHPPLSSFPPLPLLFSSHLIFSALPHSWETRCYISISVQTKSSSPPGWRMVVFVWICLQKFDLNESNMLRSWTLAQFLLNL